MMECSLKDVREAIDLAKVIRGGDQPRFASEFPSLLDTVAKYQDLRDAQAIGQVVLSVLTAEAVERGGTHCVFKSHLQAVRSLDQCHTAEEVTKQMSLWAREFVPDLYESSVDRHAVLIQRAVQLISERFKEDLTDQGLAGELGISKSHFRFLFRSFTGESFNRFVKRFRLNQARKLLLTDMTVTEIARSVGFSSKLLFTRDFAKEFGQTPTAYRRSAPERFTLLSQPAPT